jgi:hypothetical protein
MTGPRIAAVVALVVALALLALWRSGGSDAPAPVAPAPAEVTTSAPEVARLPEPARPAATDAGAAPARPAAPTLAVPGNAFGIAFDGGACKLDTDCPPGEACLGKGWTDHPSCVPGTCAQDSECPAGQVCRMINRAVTGPPVRRCTAVGDLAEGAECPGEPWLGERCAPGLRCVLGRCLKGCTLPGGAGCSADETCVDGPNGPGCHASCLNKPCPPGEECTGFGLLMACMRHVGTNCRVVPCGPGQKCMQMSDGHEVRSWCQTTCDPLKGGTCPAGQVCGAFSSLSVCYRACSADGGACGLNEECVPVTEDGSAWGCRPTF